MKVLHSLPVTRSKTPHTDSRKIQRLNPTALSPLNRLSYSTGVVLGTVQIVDCVTESDSPWFFGKFGFVLRDPEAFAAPIPAKGQLGFWTWNQ